MAGEIHIMNMDVMATMLSALCSLIGTLGGIMITSKLNLYRIEQLEKKVDKHNSLIERMYAVEKKIDTVTCIYDGKVTAIDRRLNELEHEVK